MAGENGPKKVSFPNLGFEVEIPEGYEPPVIGGNTAEIITDPVIEGKDFNVPRLGWRGTIHKET